MKRALACSLIVAVACIPAAGAKIEPPPVILPPPPPAVIPILGLGAPILTAECGTAITALTLIVPAVGGQLPIDPVPLLAGVIAACGSVPQPATHLHCGVDDTVRATLVKLAGPLSILLAVVNTKVAAPVAEEIGVVQHSVPPALLLANVSALAETALQCSGAAPSTGGTGVTPLATEPAPVSEPDSGATTPPPPPPASPSSSSPTPTSAPPPVVAPATTAVPQQSAAVAVAVTPPGGGTPVGSALVGLLLLIGAAAAVAVGLNREMGQTR